jgi:hypothetical protein
MYLSWSNTWVAICGWRTTPIQAAVRLESTPVRCGVTPWSIRAPLKVIYGNSDRPKSGPVAVSI